jgi:hypothetical protein
MSVDPQFKTAIKDWYKYDREEKELRERLKGLKRDKDGVEGIIINYMQTKNIQDRPIHIGEDVMQYAETRSYETVTKKLLLERLTDFLRSVERAKEAVDFIYVNRSHQVKASLRLNQPGRRGAGTGGEGGEEE